MVRKPDTVKRKVYSDKATDTRDDMLAARDKDSLAKKEEEIRLLAQEMDEEGKQIDEFLKNRKAEVLAVGESKA